MPTYCNKQFRGYFITLLTLLLLVGCARSAPDLPISRANKSDAEIIKTLNIDEDDLSKVCEELDSELTKVNEAIEDNELVIKGDRVKNQIVGYLGALFIFPAFGADNNDEAKENLSNLQFRKDQLYYLKSRKSCK
ncbi:hypothetical protein J0X12_10720 [Sneathiella sp. CAU 1612]|jgi:hypothetical protein|uniref:Uncharacterized protein n=1 Tax=Sneathiella sedimenti TaxID=2816034 RepID=A0ABS3F7M5_9PROT|nr:hypothetical protein [Sneathiella sedimenti]MBO0334091.1 hypothetical protein [Sneathiella sedimenti]